MSIGGRIARSVFDKAGGDGCVGRKTDPPQTAAGCSAGCAGFRTRARKDNDARACAAKGTDRGIHSQEDECLGDSPTGSAGPLIYNKKNEECIPCPAGGTRSRIRIKGRQAPRIRAAESTGTACKNGSRRRRRKATGMDGFSKSGVRRGITAHQQKRG